MSLISKHRVAFGKTPKSTIEVRLEQRLRRIEEKLSSKKKITEAVDVGNYGVETYEKIQIENHRIAMGRFKTIKKLIKYLEQEYSTIFVRYKISSAENSMNGLYLLVYLLTDSKSQLFQLGEDIEDSFSGIQVIPVNVDSRFNLRISI